MGTIQQTKNVTFCCPQHGILAESPEYFSADFGRRKLVDIPVMHCAACDKYYTPFANLLAIKPLQHKNREVAASRGRVEKSLPKALVRVPYFTETGNTDSNPTNKAVKNFANATTRHCANGYKTVPAGTLKQSAFIHKTVLTNYDCKECFICSNRLVNFVNFIEISEREAIRIPGQYCTKCNTFYKSRGAALKNLLDSYAVPDTYSIQTEYLIPQYSEKMRIFRSLRSVSLVIHLRCKKSSEITCGQE